MSRPSPRPEPDAGARSRSETVESERVLSIVFSDPRFGLRLAKQVLARVSAQSEAAIIANRAAGLAELRLGRVKAARRRLETAVTVAAATGLRHREVEARQSFAFILLQTEEPDEALRQLDAALVAPDSPQVVALMHSQRSLLLMRLARYREALEESDRALSACAQSGLLTHLGHVHGNRGIVFSYLGAFQDAESELQRALELCRYQRSHLGIAKVTHNLGFLAARKGDVPEALRLYDEALAAYEGLGVTTYPLFIDRCEVMMAANLLPEARQAAEQAVRGLESAGLAADLAEGRLMLAEVALVDGDFDVAEESAEVAARSFARQRRAGWAAHANYVSARARWRRGTPDADVVREGQLLAERLEEAGWSLQALEARIEAAKAALRAGEPNEALAIVGDVSELPRPSADERVRGWYASAIARLAAGNRPGALRALEAGLRVSEQHRAAFGATELRVRTAIHSAELAELGLELALRGRRAGSVLAWAERYRARALWAPEVRPPADSRLAQLLGELRQVVASLELAVVLGTDQREQLELKRSRLEGEIRHRALRRSPSTSRRAPEPPALRALQDELGETLLVEYVEQAGMLHVVACAKKEARVVELGPTAAIERERAAVQFAMTRLALRRSAPSSLVASAQLLARAVERLDELLVRPVADALDRCNEVVLVPTGGLHALPWALLPSLSGRSVSITPSAALWFARTSQPARGAPIVLVEGSGVPFGAAELAQLRGLYPHASVLDSDGATGAAVLGALSGAGLAHVAAHGTFRSDNPLFSSLDMADGPLTVYDLEQIAEPPGIMILSACDAGRSQVHPGNELMGTTAALLSLGTRAIVASVSPVPDEGAVEVMVRLHRRLRLGESPARALADAQSTMGVGRLEPEELASGSARAMRGLAGSAFVCFGAGGSQGVGNDMSW